ncbi:glucose/sorbosone dehydrogenase protein (plasmid) [Rhizobium phaseoli]|uniref:Sorbosone dehydrogenase family protein n=1 Tax=Rhizobium phaseoli TaxID=396 RepID=A0A7X6F4D5_9HYPH|nr:MULTISPECIES: sorbosone dehydrogenase family protein [Rhizobium]ANL50781.1 glucose/sorbosone dehydrogenase protein [Rhizobium phaseoli]MDE8761563.1 sorbosone dehydrogenase family protein [Rhizobium sp. CBK13]NKF09012.1 sorbosone dehydrogenase family protein [Rhizobium phaseoli]QPK12347.1 sorbosone dehydrogenase family protein [Rhizobium phaseoli]
MIKTRILRASILSLASSIGLTAYAQSDNFDISTQIGPNPVLPEPAMSLLADLKVAEVVGWKGGETPAVADGLKITAFAKDLANPRTVHTLPNGDVLVIQSRGPSGEQKSRPKDFIRGWIMSIAHGDSGGQQKESNLITLLRDTNRDGIVDERHDLLRKLESPFGVAWIDNTLYVASTSAILAYPYSLGQNEITAPPRLLTPLPGGPINHHWTKDLALSPNGKVLYVSVGSNSNIVENGLEAEKGRAAIWQVDRNTGAARVFASGLRNPNGLTFNPDTGVLWTVVNERDELGPNLVPDYMTSVKEGGFYGWPWSYYGKHVDARVHPSRPEMVDRAIPPDYALSSHVAALGLTFSKNSALPAAYANGAFIGEHGSWNRDSFNGYKVVYVPFENGQPSGKAQDVVTGFIKGDQAKGRPVGVGIDGTGALLVADDSGNTVWRVASADGKVTPEPIATEQVSINAEAAAPPVGNNPAVGTETTGSTAHPPTPPAAPGAPATDTEVSPGKDDALQPPQMQIAPATGP